MIRKPCVYGFEGKKRRNISTASEDQKRGTGTYQYDGIIEKRGGFRHKAVGEPSLPSTSTSSPRSRLPV